MKKLIKITTMLALVATLVLSPFGRVATPTVKAVETIKVFEDNFNVATVDTTKWTVQGNASDASTHGLGNALQINNSGYEKTLVWQKSKIENDYIIELDMSLTGVTNEWVGIFSGLGTADSNFTTITEDAGTALVFSRDGLTNWSKGAFVANQHAASDASKYAIYGGNYAFDNVGTMFSIKIEYKSVAANSGAEGAEIYYNNYATISMAKKGEPLIEVGKIFDVRINGYFGFGSMTNKGQAIIQNLVVTEQSKSPINIDFSQGSISYTKYPASTNSDANFRVINADETNFECGAMYSLQMSTNSTVKAISNSQISQVADAVELFSLKLKVSLKAMPSGGKFGLAMGLADNNSNIDESGFIFLEQIDTTTKLTRTKTGIDALTVDLSKNLSTLDFFELKVIGMYNGTLDVYVDYVKVATFSSMTFVGKFAIVTIGSEGDKTTILVDDVLLSTYKYWTTSNSYQGINFSVKDGDNIYIDTKQWFATSNVSYYDGIADFINVDYGASFGPRSKFASFVLKFDVGDISKSASSGVARSGAFGVMFGKAGIGDEPAISTGFYFLPQVSESGDKVVGMYVHGINAFYQDGNIYKMMNESFWDKDKSTVNVMVIARNSCVEVYYKFANQPESEFASPKAIFTDVNTYGYVTITASAKTNFSLSNISIIDISNNNYIK